MDDLRLLSFRRIRGIREMSRTRVAGLDFAEFLVEAKNSRPALPGAERRVIPSGVPDGFA